jgi:hypothetical protein
MRWIGARFRDRSEANHALADLRAALDLGMNDAAVAALGSTSYEGPRTSEMLLGGRFREDRIDLVLSLIARHGGEVVVDNQVRSGSAEDLRRGTGWATDYPPSTEPGPPHR